MNNHLISVIVPVYNSEMFLQDCLESVINQSYKNIEIILINDGSTDNSLNICELFAGNDSRIKVYSKENGGVASARNEGLRHASGEYVAWVDSDDTINESYIACLYNDTLCNGDVPVIALQQKNDLCDSHIISDNDIILSFLAGKLPSNMWSTLFKRELYDGLVFKNYHIGEDSMMLIDLFSKTRQISCIYCDGYHYRDNPNSITKSISIQSLQSWIDEMREQQNVVTSRFSYAQSAMSYKSVMFAIRLLRECKDDNIRNQARDMIHENFRKMSFRKLSLHQIKELVCCAFGLVRKGR